MAFNFKQLIPQKQKNWLHFVKGNLALAKYGNPAKDLNIIGVTGTDGKTSTSTLLYHILKESGLQVALISTVAAYIGDKKIDTGFHVTSPDAFQLQKLLKKVKDQGIQTVVLETTSHGFDQHRFLGITFEIGVLTNITHEHLDYHKTYQNYLEAKAKLFYSVKYAVLNKKDKSFKSIKKLVNQTATILSYDRASTAPKIVRAIQGRFPEPYNQSNAVAASLAARQMGVSETHIAQAIKSFPGIPGRMQQIPNTRGFKTIVDFAHTPNALEKALEALRLTTKGKLIAVYGSAGLRDQQKRSLMGKIGSELADEVVLTAEDPRTEPVWSIIDQMMSQVTSNHGHMYKIPDRQEAINFAISIAKPGDTVGVFGKGHEQSMCFGTVEHPWSDEKAVIKALEKVNK